MLLLLREGAIISDVFFNGSHIMYYKEKLLVNYYVHLMNLLCVNMMFMTFLRNRADNINGKYDKQIKLFIFDGCILLSVNDIRAGRLIEWLVGRSL